MKKLLIALFICSILIASALGFSHRYAKFNEDKPIVKEKVIEVTVKDTDNERKKDVFFAPTAFSLIFLYLYKHFS